MIGQAIVFIENNLHEPLNAVMVSEAVSYSYYHFHRHFLYVMGETVGSYIRSRRLTQAASQLVHGDRKVLDIAIDLRFESAESFTRAFKQKYGVTPTAYRRNGVDVLLSSHPPLNPAEIGGLVDKTPQIVSVAPKQLVGLTYAMSVADNQSVDMWNTLNELLRKTGCAFPGNRYSLFGSETDCQQTTFQEDTTASAFIGVEGAETCATDSLVERHFTGGCYAKFIHRGTVDTLLSTYRYLWGVWFPQSGYDLADRDDLEVYTERFLGPHNPASEIEIYFPIQEPASYQDSPLPSR